MSLAPLAPDERLVHIDVLRGLALFGVLLENLQHFVIPSYAQWAAAPGASLLDRGGFAMLQLLCDNKIYAIFAFLFGYGFALQMLRSEARGGSFAVLHLWRMAVLFLIGVAHSLVWTGDILSTYALLGVLLLPLRRASDRTLCAVAGASLLLPSAGLALAVAAAPHLDGAAFTSLQTTLAVEAYPSRQSAFAFAAFALGLAAGRRGLLREPTGLLALGRRGVTLALLLGATCNLAALPLLNAPGQGHLSWQGVLLEGLLALATLALAFAYVVLALRWATAPRWSARLRPLAWVGRTTLSNYLLQSCIGMGVLAHTALGPLGPITPPVGIALTFAIFATQVLLSGAWLRHFHFGPVEYLWRAATYGTLPPLLRR